MASDEIRMRRREARLKELQSLGVVWDEEDYTKIVNYMWRLHPYYGYVVAAPEYVGEPKTVMMHQIVFGAPPEGKFIDHINRNKLDNRKGNLRFVTRSENSINSRRVDYADLVRETASGSYELIVQRDGVRLHRCYASEAEALAAAEAFVYCYSNLRK